MKKLLILLSAIIVVACKNEPQKVVSLNGDIPPDEEKAWIDAYKSESLLACLKEAYGTEFDSLNAKDMSSSVNTEIIGGQMSEDADSLGRVIGSHKFEGVGDFEGRKPIFNPCLQYYNSKELDSIAKCSYKSYEKSAVPK